MIPPTEARTVSDPFGRAIRDHYHDERDEPLLQRDGEAVREHPVEAFYFDGFDPASESGAWLASWLEEPLLDLGAGAGQHALHFQDVVDTVAIEMSDHLVDVMEERGVADVRRADMFALTDGFERGRFGSALAHGTQIGLAVSMDGLRQFLNDLTFVTSSAATAVVDGYDPRHPSASELLGYRADPTPGLAYRVMHFEYEGEVGETLLFRLFGPDRLREAADDTGWDVAEVRRGDSAPDSYYRAALTRA